MTSLADDPNWSPLPGVVIEAEIGRGGMGVVYRARQTFLDRRVALKLLHSDHSADGDPSYVERFNREARILASLQHPNIAACHEAGVTSGGIPYLLMELVEGPSLGSWLADHGRLPLTQALEMALDLAGALAHAQEKGIIHRDVKPDNVLLGNRTTGEHRADSILPWTVKLIDLGIARPIDSAIDVTKPGLVVGTPITMAPEQFKHGEAIDWRVDLYGLGCVLYQSLTGVPPFSSSNIVELVTAKISGPVPDASRVVSDLPPAVVQLLRDLLDPDPARRPPSYAALGERCRFLLGRGTTTVLPRPSSTGPSSLARLLMAGLMIALLGGGGVWLAQSRPVPRTEAPPVSQLVPNRPVGERPQTPGGPVVNLLAEAFAGMPGWDMSAGEAANDEETNSLILGRGEIRHPLPSFPCEFTITLNRPRSDIIPGATTIGVTLADGKKVGMVVTDLGGQVLVRTLGGLDGSPSTGVVSLASKPELTLTILIDVNGLWSTVDGQILAPMLLPAPPVALLIGHAPAAGATASAVSLSAITYRNQR